jgi:hypothetical protein
MIEHKKALKRPFFRYYGGKFRAARKYRPPIFKTIIEPFAGAAGYACRYPESDVYLIDKSEKICAVWRYLIEVSPSEILGLPNIKRGESIRSLCLPQEIEWFLGFWCNNGSSDPKVTPTSWASSTDRRFAGWNAPQTRATIALQVAKIKHWKVICGDYTAAPGVLASWFIDPPYQGKKGSYYPQGSGSIDYEALGEWCLSRRGSITVCEGAGAKWLPFEPFGNLKSTTGQSSESVFFRDHHFVVDSDKGRP